MYQNTKYSNRKTHGFDSKKEYQRYLHLSLLEKAGEIRNLRTQVDFELLPRQNYKGKFAEHPVKYRADFVYEEHGETIVEDVKSMATRTPQYIIKRKLMLYKYGIRVREV